MGTTKENLNFDIDFGHNININSFLKVIREIVASTNVTNKI